MSPSDIAFLFTKYPAMVATISILVFLLVAFVGASLTFLIKQNGKLSTEIREVNDRRIDELKSVLEIASTASHAVANSNTNLEAMRQSVVQLMISIGASK